MRQISFEDTSEVGGGVLNCGGLNYSVSITGLSVSGSGTAWNTCFQSVVDTANGYVSSFNSGIPYGMVHVA